MAERPTQFRSGDTYEWTESFPDYAATLYDAKAKLVSSSGYQAFTAAGSGTTYTFSPTISNLTPGNYQLAIYVELKSDTTKRHTLIAVPVKVLQNLVAPTSATDTRSTARIQLDKINETLTTIAGLPQQQVAAHMRNTMYRSLEEMMRVRAMLMREVAQEEAAAAELSGEDTYPSNVGYVEFRSP